MELNSKFEELKKNKDFLRGVELFRQGKVPKSKSVPIKWVFKLVTKKEWENYYQWDESYCDLGKVGGRKDIDGGIRGGKIKIGFCVADFGSLPKDCQELTDPEELRDLDLYRRAINIKPFLIKEISPNAR